MQVGWSGEYWRLAALILTGGAIGLVFDHPALGLFGGATFASAWQLKRIRGLLRWLQQNEGDQPGLGVRRDPYDAVRSVYLFSQRHHEGRERRLNELLNRFQGSASALPDAIVALGPGWVIHWANLAAERLLGLRSRQDVGHTLTHLFRSPEIASYLSAGEFSKSLETTAPGNRDLKLLIRVIPYGSDQWLLLAQDVTDRHLLERVRKDFVANVSHELRTPLTVLSGFVENLLHEETECSQRWRRPLRLMQQQTVRMQRIVEDLLLLTRLESGRLPEARETIDVAQVAEELRTVAKSALPEHPEIRIEIDSNRKLIGDEQQIRSAFQNLIMNAVSYTSADGVVIIRWREETTGVVFEVSDTGDGIAPEDLPRLTERFYRVDTGRSRQRGGTGLGLAIVKHVLQRHGAELGIVSKLGEGSTFSCHFPNQHVLESSQESGDPADIRLDASPSR